MECIVLAGGLGTRLRNSIGALPKCMALINNRPFLYYIFKQLEQQGCTRVVLSLGYLSEVVIDWLNQVQFSFEVHFVVEEQPLGTGGGIQLALAACQANEVLVLNGDTYFDVDFTALLNHHHAQNALATLALKQMNNFERYGTVVVDKQHCIVSFEEKKFMAEGLINGGIYVLNKKAVLQKNLPLQFSFEKDFLAAYVHQRLFYGFSSAGYFIDIGIPEDYQKAQEDFRTLFV